LRKKTGAEENVTQNETEAFAKGKGTKTAKTGLSGLRRGRPCCQTGEQSTQRKKKNSDRKKEKNLYVSGTLWSLPRGINIIWAFSLPTTPGMLKKERSRRKSPVEREEAEPSGEKKSREGR